MLRVEGELRRIGSWSGRPGSDGGRLEFMDIGERHIRRIGCTSYLQDVLSTSMGQQIEVAFSAPLGGKLGHEILGIRLADGNVRMAGLSRVFKLMFALLLALPAAAFLMIGLPCGIVLMVIQNAMPTIGGLLASVGVLAIIAFILFCIYNAVMVPVEYGRAKAALSRGG